MKKLLCVICLLFSTGCGLSGARRDMRVAYDTKFEITIEESYQQTYRQLLNDIRRAGSWVWLGDNGILENDLYPDNKTASIRYCRMNLVGGEWLPFLIDIKALSDSQTNITVYSCRHGNHPGITKSSFTKQIREWYDGDIK